MGRRQIVSAFDRVAIWHAAMPTYYHFTDNPDFKIDPNFNPSNEVLGRPRERGLYVSPNSENWSRYKKRPYLVELHSDEDLLENPDLTKGHDIFGDPQEILVKGKPLDNLSVKSITRKG